MKNKMYGLYACGILLASISTASGYDDIYDPSFGVNGKVFESLSPNGKSVFNALLVQDDDKLIAAGTAQNDADDGIITLYRYNKDGSKDLTFGSEGGVTTADHVCRDSEICDTLFDIGSEVVLDAHFQSDGKIVLSQQTWSGTNGYNLKPGFGVVRFNTDGTLDTSFGQHSGFGFGGYGTYAEKSAIQDDDKILVVGMSIPVDEPRKVALTRFTQDGLVDHTFGSNGTVQTDVDINVTATDYGNDVTVQADGKIIVAGETYVSGCGDATYTFARSLLLRYDENGTLDPSFSGDGIVTFNASSIIGVSPTSSEPSVCGGNKFISVEVLPDGKILALGQGVNAPYAVFLARFNANGSLDTSFGYDGVVALFHNYSYDTFNGLDTEFTINFQDINVENMRITKNGQIVLSGNYALGSDYKHFLAIRFNANGRLDRTFGNNGLATTFVGYNGNVTYYGAIAYDLVEQSDGKIVLGGFSNTLSDPSQGVLVRLPRYGQIPPAIIMYLLN